MPRRTITYVDGEHYHIYNRGAQRATLYFSPSHYHTFIALMTMYAQEFNIDIVAVCLMPNHFHLIVVQREGGDIPAFMQKLCYTFSKRLNRELRRTGTCFEGRYKAKVCQSNEYLAHLALYIHANPVVAGLVEHPSGWEYSDFQEYTGVRKYIQSSRETVKGLFKNNVHYEKSLFELVQQKQKMNLGLQSDLAEILK